ncbi:hypothetical protein [Sinomonas terrae]|uniref:Uncharacterized protein n=1 Tax=Sinomonas terrae TaxID=2908838 RepID=A0ABS9U7E6_9MICC|nr:hypothetical protein [Sinomonas terrae]MCH6472515.1 hypothetical protein [Sinomonas terrae]
MRVGALVGLGLIIVVVLGLIVMNFVVRRQGYSIPGRTAVRCSKGHLFSTTWVEGASLQAVRLGPFTRFQYCPVGRHWAIVHPVKADDLSDDERRAVDGGSG